MDKNKQQTVGPGLYLVSTPIGNMEDITLRALNVLKKSDIILCEDTRRSGKLLSNFQIKSKLIPYHKFNEKKVSNKVIDLIKNSMSGLLNPYIDDQIIGSAEVLEIFKVSKVGKVAGSKVINGEINQDGKARLIRDGSVVYNGKILTIFREKDQTKKVSEGLECGITLKDFSDFKKKDIIEVYNSIITARRV